MCNNKNGFGLAGLAMALAVLALLAIIAMPKVIDTGSLVVEMAARMIESDIRYAQQIAVTENTGTEILFSADSYTAFRLNDGSEITEGGHFPVENLGTNMGVSISNPHRIAFNSLGEPTDGYNNPITVYLIKDASKNKEITVTTITGKVEIN